jgi:hypothetical protein
MSKMTLRPDGYPALADFQSGEHLEVRHFAPDALR